MKDEQLSEFNPKELIERAKQGDSEAFGLLYQKYFVPVFRYIYARIRNKEETEDLAQTVFLKVYQAIGRVEWQGKSLLAYFFTVSRNTLIDFYRKKKAINVEDVEEHRIASLEVENERRTEVLDNKQLVDLAIHSLSGFYQEVITLKFLQELSNQEIALILGKSEAAIRQAQCRALKKLRDKFRDIKIYDY